MAYDILSSIIELTDSETPLFDRLSGITALLKKKFSAKGCAVYVYDKDSSVFRHFASSGAKGVFPDEYALQATFTATPSVKGKSSKLTQTKAYKLSSGEKVYGVLVLELKPGDKLTKSEHKLLEIISRHLTYTVKSDRNLIKLKRLYDERKSLQMRLIQAEKIMALGELSATLAHEIKTPLVSIGGYASRLRRKLESSSPYTDYLDHITRAVAKLENLINEILGFATEKALKFVKTDFNALVRESIAIFTESAKTYNIDIRTDIGDTPIEVEADPTLIKIAIDNIIANAIQSMTGGGMLDISTKQEDGLAVLEITDTGGGVEPALLGDIFNPFFTTKEHGTGLGLTITHKIVSRHKGSIDVVNSYGRGMKFIIRVHCSKA